MFLREVKFPVFLSDLWFILLFCMQQIKQLLNLYKEEKYFLVVNQQKPRDFEVFVSFKVCTYTLLKKHSSHLLVLLKAEVLKSNQVHWI